MAEEIWHTIPKKDIPPTPTYFQTPTMYAPPLPPTLAGSFPSAVYLSVDRASGSPVRKGVCESSGMPRLRQNASEMRPDVPLVTLAPRGIFRVPYGTPSDASVIRMFAFGFPIVNSDLSFDRKSSVGAGGLKWGADSLPLFGCVLN
ncbi:hypothetical protein CDL15_Pgr014597 [Punica granatum]|uniref:Uncharacterized protein n=1 Tax=Punica granatum TaxID=22663 RepID=A0A218XYJ0_PUNGR|nr:hypothetical protein CDL15_Pgr014597 [Punica granatum]